MEFKRVRPKLVEDGHIGIFNISVYKGNTPLFFHYFPSVLSLQNSPFNPPSSSTNPSPFLLKSPLNLKQIQHALFTTRSSCSCRLNASFKNSQFPLPNSQPSLTLLKRKSEVLFWTLNDLACGWVVETVMRWFGTRGKKLKKWFREEVWVQGFELGAELVWQNL